MENEKKELVEFEDENEFAVRDELREKRKDIKSFEELVSFLEYVKDNCNTGYGTAPRSMAQAALAVAWYLSSEFGITGFQAGFVMWDFIMDWHCSDNKCGMKFVNYDDMLYPQHDYKFEKTISSDTWKSLQEQAAERLKERTYAHPDVIFHWQSIVDGNVPFGYSVKDD
jgi:hypothetical protein